MPIASSVHEIRAGSGKSKTRGQGLLSAQPFSAGVTGALNAGTYLLSAGGLVTLRFSFAILVAIGCSGPGAEPPGDGGSAIDGATVADAGTTDAGGGDAGSTDSGVDGSSDGGLGTPIQFVGAGDIAKCSNNNGAGAAATAALLDGMPNAFVFTLGDTVYESGTQAEWEDCYDPLWGRFNDRIYPAVGDHDYKEIRDTFSSIPYADRPWEMAYYFQYFGSRAGDPELAYYSFNLGKWHIVVLNSHCSIVGGCSSGPMRQWLEADLAASDSTCQLAYMHHPRFTSGIQGDGSPRTSFTSVAPLWDTLVAHGVELIMAGHDHHYERFDKMLSDGTPDAAGPRFIIAGTGGANHTQVGGTRHPSSVVANDDTFGLLQLQLHEDRYDWDFIPIEGGTFTDNGSDVCR